MFRLVLVAYLLLISSATAQTRGPAVQNPVLGYNEYCLDPAVTAMMHYAEKCVLMRGVVKIDLFNDDQSAVQTRRHARHWATYARGLMTRPHIPFNIHIGNGDHVLDFGDIRWFGYGLGPNTRMAIRVNGADRLTSCPNKTGVCLEQGSGFTLFDTNMTELKLLSLDGKPIRVEIGVFIYHLTTDEPVGAHRLPTCERDFNRDTHLVLCGKDAAELMEYRLYEIGEWVTKAGGFILK